MSTPSLPPGSYYGYDAECDAIEGGWRVFRRLVDEDGEEFFEVKGYVGTELLAHAILGHLTGRLSEALGDFQPGSLYGPDV